MSSITICSNNLTLLSTRKMLLEREGICVQTAHGVTALDRSGSKALILCYSLSTREQRQAIALQKQLHPGARILVLGGDVREALEDGCESLTAYPEPQVLLKKARQLAT